jgi:peptide/nickel transport system substrate-binding protein
MGWCLVLFRRVGLTLVAAALALSGPAALAPTSVPAAHAATPTKLVVALTQDIDSLNPFLSFTASGTQLGRLMYEFLTTYSPKDESPVPALATSWSTSADRLTWTYTIRSGVKWSDGQPVTAKDIAFTYNLMMTNKVAATANGNFVANFASVTAPNDTTLVITTKQPQASMLALDIPIVPAHIWSGVKDIQNYPNTPTGGQPVVGDGPFLLSEYKQGQYVKLIANPTYWRGRPKIDELDFVHFDNTDAAVQALRKGDADLVFNLSPAQYNALQNTANITTNRGQGGRFVELLMNPGAATNTNQPIGDGNPVLHDVAFRRALAQAIDAKTLAKQVYGGYAEVAGGYIPQKYDLYHWQPGAAQARTFDLTAAGQALTAAGYPEVNGQRMDKSGKPITLRLYGESDRTQDAQEVQYVAGWLKSLGIATDTQLMTSDKLNALGAAGTYDLALSSWGVDPDPDAILTIQTCGQRPDAQGQTGNTDDFFCDPTYDQLYDQQVTAASQQQRVAIVKQMQQLLYQQVPMVTLLYPNMLEAYRSDRFQPFQVQPDPGGVITNQNGYWSYLEATPKPAASGGGVSAATIVIVVIVVLAVVVLLVLWLLSRRRRTVAADDRE